MKKLFFFILSAAAAAVTAAPAAKTMPVPVQSAKKSPLLMTAAPLPQSLPIGSKAPVPRILGWVTKEEVDFTKVIGKKPLVLFFYVNSNGCAKTFKVISGTAKAFKGKVVFAAIGCEDYPKLKSFFRLKELQIPVAADLEVQTLNCFLRNEDRVPAAVVIDAQGVIAWRGQPPALAAVLKELLDGKYDVRAAAEREQFYAKLHQLLRAKNFEALLTLLAAGRLKYPDAWDLLSLQCSIYAEKKHDYAHALELVEAEIKRHPEKYANYLLGIQIARSDRSGKTPLAPWFDRIIARFSDQPRLLIGLARNELKLSTAEIDLGAVCKLCRAAWHAPKFASLQEQGAIGREYARALYYCARPDLAAEQIQSTMKLYPKEHKMRSALQGDLNYYNAAAKLGRELKGL